LEIRTETQDKGRVELAPTPGFTSPLFSPCSFPHHQEMCAETYRHFNSLIQVPSTSSSPGSCEQLLLTTTLTIEVHTMKWPIHAPEGFTSSPGSLVAGMLSRKGAGMLSRKPHAGGYKTLLPKDWGMVKGEPEHSPLKDEPKARACHVHHGSTISTLQHMVWGGKKKAKTIKLKKISGF